MKTINNIKLTDEQLRQIIARATGRQAATRRAAS
jgi:hypothetical protein